MRFFICTHCERQFEDLDGLRKHRGRIHKLNAEDTYHHYVLSGGAIPTCLCGCGGKTKFISLQKGYRPYVNGHNSMTSENNFHKNPEAFKRGVQVRAENWKKGLYRKWWEEDTAETRQKIEGIKEKLRNDKERGKRISETLQGHEVSEDTKKKIGSKAKQRYNDRPELRTRLSQTRLEWMRNNSKVKTSKLEVSFEKILSSIGLVKDVDYIHNHLVSKIKTFFDFYLPKHNIMIEADGDFYHCNPVTHPEALYEIQKKNLINDKRKNTWTLNHGITLLRYWEKDINERPEWVMKDLKKKLGYLSE
jgi:very-short-patch-repair endonuclease